jgi:hypothetical protein
MVARHWSAAKAGRQALELGTADNGLGANGASSWHRKHRQYRCR